MLQVRLKNDIQNYGYRSLKMHLNNAQYLFNFQMYFSNIIQNKIKTQPQI